MSIALSYDQAAFNIAQTVKFNTEVNKQEGRLGAWKCTSSLHYVSSSDWKIAKLWYDFLVLIGVVIDHKDQRFQSLQENSSNQFKKLEQEFNKEQIAQENVEKEQINQKFTKVTTDLADNKKTLSNLEKEKGDLLKANIEGSAKTEELKKALDASKINQEAILAKIKILSSENSRLAKQVQDLNQIVQSKEKDIQDFNVQLKTHNQQFEETSHKVERHFSAHKKEIEDLNEKIAQLQKENAKLLAEKKQRKGQKKELDELKKKLNEFESHKKEAAITSQSTEEVKAEKSVHIQEKEGSKEISDAKTESHKPQDGEMSPRGTKRSFSIAHKIQKLMKPHDKVENKEDHKAENKNDSKEEHKPENKVEFKADIKEEHKPDHKAEHKSENSKEEHKADQKTEHKAESKEEHKTELKEDHKVKEDRKLKKHEKRDSTSAEASPEAASQDH